MVECHASDLIARVRFPPSAPKPKKEEYIIENIAKVLEENNDKDNAN